MPKLQMHQTKSTTAHGTQIRQMPTLHYSQREDLESSLAAVAAAVPEVPVSSTFLGSVDSRLSVGSPCGIDALQGRRLSTNSAAPSICPPRPVAAVSRGCLIPDAGRCSGCCHSRTAEAGRSPPGSRVPGSTGSGSCRRSRRVGRDSVVAAEPGTGRSGCCSHRRIRRRTGSWSVVVLGWTGGIRR